MSDALNNGCVLGGGEGCLSGGCDVGSDVCLCGVCGGDVCLYGVCGGDECLGGVCGDTGNLLGGVVYCGV